MPASALPGDGPVRIGQVGLPAGRRVGGGWGSGGAVAWVTDGPVEDPGLIWSALSRESAVTGLVPFLAATLEDEGSRAQKAESLALAADAGFDSDYADYRAMTKRSTTTRTTRTAGPSASADVPGTTTSSMTPRTLPES